MLKHNNLYIIGQYSDLKAFADNIIADYKQIWRPNLENICGVMYLTLLYTGKALPMTKVYMTIYDKGNMLFICDVMVIKGPIITDELYNKLLKSLYNDCLCKYEERYPVKIVYKTREA